MRPRRASPPWIAGFVLLLVVLALAIVGDSMLLFARGMVDCVSSECERQVSQFDSQAEGFWHFATLGFLALLLAGSEATRPSRLWAIAFPIVTVAFMAFAVANGGVLTALVLGAIGLLAIGRWRGDRSIDDVGIEMGERWKPGPGL